MNMRGLSLLLALSVAVPSLRAAEPDPQLKADIECLLDVKERLEVRQNAVKAMGERGEKAAAAVPALRSCLTDPKKANVLEAELRAEAIRALGRIGRAAKPAVPELVRELSECYPEKLGESYGGGDWIHDYSVLRAQILVGALSGIIDADTEDTRELVRLLRCHATAGVVVSPKPQKPGDFGDADIMSRFSSYPGRESETDSRVAAIGLLAKLKTDQATAALRRLLRSPMKDVADAAKTALNGK